MAVKQNNTQISPDTVNIVICSKLGQTDLIFGLWSELISRSLQAVLQVSTCRGMICATLVNTQTGSFSAVILLAELEIRAHKAASITQIHFSACFT